jgi:hypothetical protein
MNDMIQKAATIIPNATPPTTPPTTAPMLTPCECPEGVGVAVCVACIKLVAGFEVVLLLVVEEAVVVCIVVVSRFLQPSKL